MVYYGLNEPEILNPVQVAVNTMLEGKDARWDIVARDLQILEREFRIRGEAANKVLVDEVPDLECTVKEVIKKDFFENLRKINNGETEMVSIDSALKAVANKKLRKEIEEELKKTDPVDAEKVIASAKEHPTEADRENKNEQEKEN